MKKSARRKKSTLGNLVGGLFSLLILVLIGALAFKFYPQFASVRTGKFDRFNLVVVGRDITLVSLNSRDKSIAIVRMPADLYIPEVVHGYGQYKTASVYPAGELDRRGGETAAGTVSEFLGIPVDGFYYSDRVFTDPKNFFLSPDFFLTAKSDIALPDRIAFFVSVWAVRFDKVKVINLGQFTSTLLLADGSSVQGLDKAEVDSILSGFLTEGKLLDENFRTEVVNTTKMAGLGARAVRLLSNIGLSVVNVESGDSPLDHCLIQATEKTLKSMTVARIARVYSCKIEKKPAEERAAITVKLGQDYVDFLTK